ncbi:VC0807 family protein [Alishewanella sp. HH-ZS]|uniref:VC0807 family protein n=1 Tax=Alishewanella sp. HH-ZS TaxID=1856684 RepID=UPI00082374AC|nr:VC0807 family protein [Alishewanella sp. HH-ZS]OCW98112.1 MFS transporter [Alishewanella sp. HH-ZS]
MSDSASQTKPKKGGGLLPNLLINVAIPAIILSKFSGEQHLGPVWGLVVALAFPVLYGLWDLKQAGKVNFFSVLGVISVLLTGGIALLQLDAGYIAIKEAAIPGAIGLAVLISQYTPYPLVQKFILNGEILDTDKLYQALAERQSTAMFERKLAQAGYLVAASFFLSSALNYILAKVILVSPPGTTAFNEELGRMTWLSYPVIVLPSMLVLFFAIWFIFSSISKLTGRELDSFLNQP